MSRKRDYTYAIALILICSLFLVLYFQATNKKILYLPDHSIKQGVFDLSDIELSENDVVKIEGDAEFYWNKLLSPNDFKNDSTLQPDGYLKIPGIWNKFILNGNKVGGFGYGTYHFKIKVNEDKLYGIYIKAFDTEYKLWANDVSIEEGKVGETEFASTPSWKRRLVMMPTENGEIDLVLQISNFRHRKGGAEEPMYFGTTNAITQFKLTKTIIEALFLGILLMLGFYHLVFYTFLPKEFANGLFGIGCLLVSLRLFTTGEKLILEIFPNLNWFVVIRLEYLSYTLALPLLLIFVYSFYKHYFSKIFIQGITVLSILFALLILIAPPKIFTYTPGYFQVLVFVSFMYVLVVLTISTLKKEENSVIFLAGALLFSIILANDVLYFDKVVNTGYLMYFGLSILAFSFSIVLSKKFSETFIKNKVLSDKFEVYNRELEETIETRTQFIVDQKNEIKAQAERLQIANDKLVELNTFKDSLTQMIVHDLKNPLNIVLNFSKDDRVVFAGTQMLNLVHNLLDVQRYEQSTMKLNIERTSVNQLIKNAIYQMQYLVKEKNINLNIDFSEEYSVDVDQEIMSRVFVNLLSNALKFTPSRGSISIHSSLNNNFVEICFTDSGPGIPNDQKELIFQKFGQYLIQRAGKSGSTGIGLAFCKMAIEAHKGSIDFKSELGKGTIFCCQIPSVSKAIQSGTTGNTEINFIKTLTDFTFSKEEKMVLSEIVVALENTKIYEISKIKHLTSRVEVHKTENISRWVSELKKAIWNSDYELFTQLLKMVKK